MALTHGFQLPDHVLRFPFPQLRPSGKRIGIRDLVQFVAPQPLEGGIDLLHPVGSQRRTDLLLECDKLLPMQIP